MKVTATIGAQKIDTALVMSMTLVENQPFAAPDGAPLGTREQTLWTSSDGSVETGVWECDAGRFQANFADYGELIHVVSGEVICTPDDGGDEFTLRAGTWRFSRAGGPASGMCARR